MRTKSDHFSCSCKCFDNEITLLIPEKLHSGAAMISQLINVNIVTNYFDYRFIVSTFLCKSPLQYEVFCFSLFYIISHLYLSLDGQNNTFEDDHLNFEENSDRHFPLSSYTL